MIRLLHLIIHRRRHHRICHPRLRNAENGGDERLRATMTSPPQPAAAATAAVVKSKVGNHSR